MYIYLEPTNLICKNLSDGTGARDLTNSQGSLPMDTRLALVLSVDTGK